MAHVRHVDDDDAYDVGYEEGKLLLPSHVLSEAFGTKLSLNNKRPQKNKQQGQPRGQPRSNGGGRRWTHKKSNNYKFASKPAPRPPPSPLTPLYQNPIYVNGGPGTQVFFLNSYSRITSGTGVFIPQRPNTRSNKKSASAPVFIPPRVVHALPYIPIFVPTRVAEAIYFDVHAMDIPPTPVPELYRSWGEVCYNNDSMEKKDEEEKDDDDDDVKQCGGGDVICDDETQISYPKIILPEEWTY